MYFDLYELLENCSPKQHLPPPQPTSLMGGPPNLYSDTSGAPSIAFLRWVGRCAAYATPQLPATLPEQPAYSNQLSTCSDEHSIASACSKSQTLNMAEREGFEPPIPVKVCLISSQVHSTGLCHLSVDHHARARTVAECFLIDSTTPPPHSAAAYRPCFRQNSCGVMRWSVAAFTPRIKIHQGRHSQFNSAAKRYPPRE
jgi:hypothetical protein